MNDAENWVPLRQLAAELGVHASNARKIALGMGIEPMRRQPSDGSSHQRTLSWTRAQVDAIVEARRRAGFRVP